MRILQINGCHYPRGGSETVYFNTSKMLEENGHDVAYFSAHDHRNIKTDYEKYFIPFDNIRRLSTLKKISKIPGYLYNRKTVRSLEKLLKDFKPEIAHVHLFYAVLSVSVLRTLKRYNVPVVHTVHDYRLLCPVKTLLDINMKVCELCKDRNYYHCFQKKCSDGRSTQSFIVMLEAYIWKYFVSPLKNIDHYIFVSNFIRNKHIEFNSVFKDNNSQLYNFTNFIEQNGVLIQGEYFLFFGRLSAEKGIKTLLSVFLRRKDLKLVIAGTGPLKSYVEETIKTSPNIEYVGFKSGNNLFELIKNSSFIILPSEWYENNPLTIIEAYAFGKPVIGANIGGIPELINDGVNGFIFEPGNKKSLESKLDDARKIKWADYEKFSLSVQAFARSNFDKGEHYKRLLKIYMDAINKKGNQLHNREAR